MTRWKLPTKPIVRNPTIFDQVERTKQAGIEAAFQHADSYWKNAAKTALRECAENMREFASDDVWRLIAKTGTATGENRALGAIMQAASRAGMIQKTGRYRETKRSSQHKQPIAIWRSNIYRGTA